MPELVRTQIQDALWREADDLGWTSLGDGDRARHYERWTRDTAIGVRLGHYMDPRKVRVYIKDTLLKPYERDRLSDSASRVWTLLGISDPTPDQVYIKPHGRRLRDGRVICWGKSRDWKLVLMAVFERAALASGGRPHAAVLIEGGRAMTPRTRELAAQAAEGLGIARVEWIE